MAALLLLPGAAHAGLNDSVAAAQSGDYLGAVKALAVSLEETLTTAIDTAAPKVERGLGTIEALIGDAYYYGHGVSRDYGEAVRMYRKAAAKSNATAQSTLGDIYFYGRGAPQDFVEAVKWWTLAAEANIATAQLNLSVMLANGDGTPQDYVSAHMYANLAASQLPPGEDRDTAIKNRDIVAKLMSREQLAEAQRLALEWRAKQSN
ncbi:MAG: sel1 repeat family protein [Proteobacteria bacterium]|nr:sel1 repeat family protein [Pseudomonadota bacterium]